MGSSPLGGRYSDHLVQAVDHQRIETEKTVNIVCFAAGMGCFVVVVGFVVVGFVVAGYVVGGFAVVVVVVFALPREDCQCGHFHHCHFQRHSRLRHCLGCHPHYHPVDPSPPIHSSQSFNLSYNTQHFDLSRCMATYYVLLT